jgi:hypothetical protein
MTNAIEQEQRARTVIVLKEEIADSVRRGMHREHQQTAALRDVLTKQGGATHFSQLGEFEFHLASAALESLRANGTLEALRVEHFGRGPQVPKEYFEHHIAMQKKSEGAPPGAHR